MGTHHFRETTTNTVGRRGLLGELGLDFWTLGAKDADACDPDAPGDNSLAFHSFTRGQEAFGSRLFTQFCLVMKTETLIQAFDFKHTCGNLCLVLIYSWAFSYFN